MIVLFPGDELIITAPAALGAFPNPVEWYVSWEVFPTGPAPFFNLYNNYFGFPFMVMVPPSGGNEYVIREISAVNTNADPVGIAIQITGRGPAVTLFHANLSSHGLLKYSAAPGQNMGWQIFDGNGNLISANS